MNRRFETASSSRDSLGTTLDVSRARARLPELLRRVANGARVTITRRGKPVAMLVAVVDTRRRAIDDAIVGLRAFAKGRRLRVPLRSLIEQGRR